MEHLLLQPLLSVSPRDVSGERVQSGFIERVSISRAHAMSFLL